MASHNLELLPTFDRDAVNIIVETSKGQRHKLKYEPKYGVLRFEKLLPLGHVFPFDFGFLPSTIGDDGDPLDVLLLGHEAAPAGSLVLGKLVAVLEAEQTEEGQTKRNDRLIAIPLEVKSRKPLQPAILFDQEWADAIAQFFVSYNKLQGKEFKPLGTHGEKRAYELVKQGMARSHRVGKKKNG
jgi:inorganic pyrophosphatase